jgi:hypothetical protein
MSPSAALQGFVPTCARTARTMGAPHTHGESYRAGRIAFSTLVGSARRSVGGGRPAARSVYRPIARSVAIGRAVETVA